MQAEVIREVSSLKETVLSGRQKLTDEARRLDHLRQDSFQQLQVELQSIKESVKQASQQTSDL